MKTNVLSSRNPLVVMSLKPGPSVFSVGPFVIVLTSDIQSLASSELSFGGCGTVVDLSLSGIGDFADLRLD